MLLGKERYVVVGLMGEGEGGSKRGSVGGVEVLSLP